ncbi:MAG: hypothetical protein FJY44_08045, partial [Betaproteobacteria bacterium]|nr:hypothetical protein [Betaproteobacteria bacterium]
MEQGGQSRRHHPELIFLLSTETTGARIVPNSTGPLSRFTVLDLTRARSGPTAVRQLADWGANVIKVEELGEQDGDGSPFDKRHGPDFQNLHRNKRSLTLNLKSPEGVAVFRKMAATADVIVENYR